MTVGMSGSSPTEYPSTLYIGRRANDGPGASGADNYSPCTATQLRPRVLAA